MKPRHEMLLAHASEPLRSLRRPSPADPLRVLVSGCLAGWACGVDGTDYGMAGWLEPLTASPIATTVAFCPEDHGLGTPRSTPDIHGGDGFDVIDGVARVLDQHGIDLTDAMLAGSRAMCAFALDRHVELAILMDMSAACGSQVISDGCRLVDDRRYRAGVGVAAACLLRAGIPVIAQRDHSTLSRLRKVLDPGFVPADGLRDHHETDWYRTYFGSLDETGQTR